MVVKHVGKIFFWRSGCLSQQQLRKAAGRRADEATWGCRQGSRRQVKTSPDSRLPFPRCHVHSRSASWDTFTWNLHGMPHRIDSSKWLGI